MLKTMCCPVTNLGIIFIGFLAIAVTYFLLYFLASIIRGYYRNDLDREPGQKDVSSWQWFLISRFSRKGPPGTISSTDISGNYYGGGGDGGCNAG